ncbi:MAG: RNase adapter RapZ, partial [Oscillospiraceae bacterium]|nr:RNase adapter RapZ [Oscillospiraceae bacterium]
LIPKFAEVCLAGTGTYERVAMVCDIRGGERFDGLFEAMDALRGMKFQYKVLFVDADDAAIIKRYKETRRSHPLLGEVGSLSRAVERERELMEPVRERADYTITTTSLPVQKLRGQVLDMFAPHRKSLNEMSISVTSFGFKYGIPLEADLVFDVRFLPNPFYVAELRLQTGLDRGVADYVFGNPTAQELMEHLRRLMDFLLPHFVEEGKSALVIAVGCTGGRHRSVAVTHALCEYIQGLGYAAGENHRDMTRA